MKLPNVIYDWWNIMGLVIFVFPMGLIACVHPISEKLRSEIESHIMFQHVFDQTEAYIGKSVIFGGVIVGARNFDDWTEIEVIQKDLNSFGYPSREDKTQGRFIFVKNGYLEPEVWTKGRYVTGGGIVKGRQTGKIDKKQYSYPLIEAVELKLWESSNPSPYSDSFYRSYYFYGYGNSFSRFGNMGSMFFPY